MIEKCHILPHSHHSRQGDIPNLDILVAPLVEELDAANLLGNVLGEDGVTLRRLDLDFAGGVRHFGCLVEEGLNGGGGVVDNTDRRCR